MNRWRRLLQMLWVGDRKLRRDGHMARKRKRSPKQPAEQTFREVERVVAEQRLSRTGAFKEIAKRTGRSPGTIATSYYRFRQRRTGGGAKGVNGHFGRRKKRSGVKTLLNQLALLIERQELEISRLQKQAAWADKIRKVLRSE